MLHHLAFIYAVQYSWLNISFVYIVDNNSILFTLFCWYFLVFIAKKICNGIHFRIVAFSLSKHRYMGLLTSGDRSHLKCGVPMCNTWWGPCLTVKSCNSVCFRFEEPKTKGIAFFQFCSSHLFAYKLLWRIAVAQPSKISLRIVLHTCVHATSLQNPSGTAVRCLHTSLREESQWHSFVRVFFPTYAPDRFA